jgi:hypothetical protein
MRKGAAGMGVPPPEPSPLQPGPEGRSPPSHEGAARAAMRKGAAGMGVPPPEPSPLQHGPDGRASHGRSPPSHEGAARAAMGKGAAGMDISPAEPSPLQPGPDGRASHGRSPPSHEGAARAAMGKGAGGMGILPSPPKWRRFRPLLRAMNSGPAAQNAKRWVSSGRSRGRPSAQSPDCAVFFCRFGQTVRSRMCRPRTRSSR